MKLYFAPLACSLATRIALYEAGATADFVQVDLKAGKTASGDDYAAINPMRMVPVLELDDGARVFENSAILQAVADALPRAGLAPTDAAGRRELQRWLGFVGTELHKATFGTLVDPSAPDAAKDYARGKLDRRMSVLDAHLKGREFLLDRFSVADAYLVTVLNWSRAVGVDLGRWPAVHEYYQRIGSRDATARAMGEEFALYQEEQKQPAAVAAR